MELILRVPTSVPLDQVTAFIVEAESAGFFGVAVPDTQLTGRDAYLALALAAQRTSSIHLYSMVSNPITRHASVLASTMQTIEELAPGRLHVALGTGAASVTAIGRRPASVKALRDMITALKKLLSGEEAEFRGSNAKLSFASQQSSPILLAGRGPKILGLAGQLADGIVPYVGMNPDTISYAREKVAAGAAQAGRNIGALEEILDVHVGIASSQDEARAMARPLCAYWVSQPSLADLLVKAGLEIDAGYQQATTWGEAQKLAPTLPDALVSEVSDVIGAYGSPEHVTERLRRAADWGINRIYVRPAQGEAVPHQTLKAFRDVIIPALARSS